MSMTQHMPDTRLVPDGAISRNGARKPARLAVIGCGLRSEAYLQHLASTQGQDWILVGLADPNPTAIAYFQALYGGPHVPTFQNGESLYAALGDDLDAVLIGTPNALHREAMIAAVNRKLITWLEKPVATTLEDCAAMWQAYVRAGQPPLGIGFVLRYLPFYTRIRELLDQKAIGEVLTIQATEEMGADLTGMYLRSWRRQQKHAGTLLLEKCTHDLDVLTWMVGAGPIRVTSIGTQARFAPRAEAAQRCRECQLVENCRYSPQNIRAYSFTGDSANTKPADLTAMRAAITPGFNDLCVYHTDKDILDRESITLEYPGGILASFTVTMDQPRTRRTMKIQGTLGQIELDLGSESLTLTTAPRRASECPKAQRITITHDGSGHHGGDSVTSNQFHRMMIGQSDSPPAGLRVGIDACLVAFAAEHARQTGRVVDIDPFRARVFGSAI